MRKFRVRVHGEEYEVEVEEVGGEAAAPQRAPQAQSEQQPAPRTAPRQSTGGEAVKAPLPGTVLDVRVSPGQDVTSGQVLLILEAMKMENEVTSPRDGKVKEVKVSKGANVTSGDLLVLLE